MMSNKIQRCLFGVVALALVVLCDRVAQANSLSPYVYFWPGIICLAIEYSFPASVLAAFIERPFCTRAGIADSALWYSLQANFVSTVVGILLAPFGYPALYTLGPLWSVAAFGISCVVECAYLSWKTKQELVVRQLVLGNAISSLVLVALPPLAIVLRRDFVEVAMSLEPHHAWMLGAATVGSLALFAVSFFMPSRLARREEARVVGDSLEQEEMSFGPVEGKLTEEHER